MQWSSGGPGEENGGGVVVVVHGYSCVAVVLVRMVLVLGTVV